MKIVIKITLITLLWLLVIIPLDLPPDAGARLQMAHSFWTGSEETSLADTDPRTAIGADGRRYYFFDVGQSLLMLPADWLGTQVHKIYPKFSDSLTRQAFVNVLVVIPLNILLVISIYWLLRLFEFSPPIAASSSLILFLATTALHHAQVFQHNNSILLCVVLAYSSVLSYLKSRKIIYILISGLGIGSAILIRQTSVLHGLTILIFLTACLLYERQKISQYIQNILVWLMGVFLFIFLSRLFDYWRFGSFSKTGLAMSMEQLNARISGQLPKGYPWSNPAEVGIWGVLFSPAKSIFIYDPLFLPCLVLGATLFKRLSFYLKIYLVVATLGLVFHIGLTSKLDYWHGDGAWAARYHVTSVHLILIPLIALLLIQLSQAKVLQRWLIISLIAFSFLVQLPALVFDPSVNSGIVFFAKPEGFQRFRWAERVDTVRCWLTRSEEARCRSYEKVVGSQRISLDSRVSLWPMKFQGMRNVFWLIWGLMFLLAMATTIIFLVSTLGKA